MSLSLFEERLVISDASRSVSWLRSGLCLSISCDSFVYAKRKVERSSIHSIVEINLDRLQLLFSQHQTVVSKSIHFGFASPKTVSMEYFETWASVKIVSTDVLLAEAFQPGPEELYSAKKVMLGTDEGKERGSASS